MLTNDQVAQINAIQPLLKAIAADETLTIGYDPRPDTDNLHRWWVEIGDECNDDGVLEYGYRLEDAMKNALRAHNFFTCVDALE